MLVLRILSIVGEALNFGARRMETIIRVTWLPLVLMLITNMVMVLMLLSGAKGELITLADIGSFELAEAHAVSMVWTGVMTGSKPVITIVGVSVLVNLILVASFMAPLIRLAGLGEKPAPGVVKAPFGLDQLRYLISGLVSFLFVAVFALLPIFVTSRLVMKHIQSALTKIYVRFPEESSLHTIKLATGGEVLLERGQQWIYSLGIPLIAAVPFFLGLWGLLVIHFRPRNRASASGSNWLLRSLVIFGVLLLVLAGLPCLMLFGTTQFSLEGFVFVSIYLLAILISAYVTLRVYPYHGVVVNRRSFAVGNTLSVTRGWNLIRLAAVFILLAGGLFLIQEILSSIVVPLILSTLLTIFSAASSYTKLLSGGEEATWLLPTVIWIWTGFNIFLSLFWAFFTYGVMAGLAGRLYRDSETPQVTR